MSKLYSKEDVNVDKRLGYIEDALNEVFARLEELERPTKKQKPAKKKAK